MPIPLELITMGAGFVGSAVTTLFKQSMDKRSALLEATMIRSTEQAKIYDQARKNGDKGFKVTRRIIALGVIFSIIWATMVVPVFWPNIPITVGLSEVSSGFWFFSDPREIFNWYTFNGGIVITPLMSHMGSAITGFFFGNQVAR